MAWRLVVYGALVVLIMTLRPEGMMGTWELTPGNLKAVWRKLFSKRKARHAEKGSMNAMTILELQDVTKKFGGVVAVDNFSHQLQPVRLYAIIGPNGAGKTTIFNLITGIYLPTSGHITVQRRSKFLVCAPTRSPKRVLHAPFRISASFRC